MNIGIPGARRPKTATMPHDFQADIDAIGAIPVVATLLEVVCRTTNMRFAAIARVTQDRWVCCASHDDLNFGLRPGGELWVETTICEEIRKSGAAVVIDEVASDAVFSGHPTPALYGFQSYISVPILLADGSFFGTLCAIDPAPNLLNTVKVRGMFELFARLIAHELDTQTQLAAMAQENEALKHRFRGGLGHDMRNTLAAMEAGARLLGKTVLDARGQMIVAEMESAAKTLSQQISDAMAASRGN
jgi:GAF domain-containing protein